jgi:SAM-dependent methyltransferase
MEHVFFRPIVLADAARLPFASGSFDRVHALDLLDQRAVNPGAAVSEMGRVLRPGGEAVLRAPAVPWLLGAHDAMWGGTRRFRRSELEALVRAAGLRVQRLTYANTLLFPVAAASRLLARAGVGGGNDLHPLPPALNNALRAVLDGEARWLRSHNLPYGLSLLCVAVRPEK